jgi:hypothetical protein
MEKADSRFLLSGNAFDARLEQELNELTDKAESQTIECISQATNEDNLRTAAPLLVALAGCILTFNSGQ